MHRDGAVVALGQGEVAVVAAGLFLLFEGFGGEPVGDVGGAVEHGPGAFLPRGVDQQLLDVAGQRGRHRGGQAGHRRNDRGGGVHGDVTGLERAAGDVAVGEVAVQPEPGFAGPDRHVGDLLQPFRGRGRAGLRGDLGGVGLG